MRQRIFTDSSSNTQEYTFRWGSKTPVVWTYNYTVHFPLRSFSCMWDEVNTNFLKRRAAGELFNNPKYKVSYELTNEPYAYEASGTYLGQPCQMKKAFEVNGSGVSWPPFFADTIAIEEWLVQFEGERDVAIASAWANVDESELASLASLGEMPETVAWINSLLYRGIRLLKWFRKKQNLLKTLKGLTSKQRLDAVSNLWLELRYAVRPLVFEMQAAVKALQKAIKENTRKTARGLYRTETSEESSSVQVCHQVNLDVLCVSQRHSEYRGGVLYSIDEDVNGILAIWGLDKPLEAIYELTFLSFVLDWFFNVGSIISAWEGQAGLTPLISWVSEKHRIVCSAEGVGASPIPAYASQVAKYGTLGFGKKQVVLTVERRVPSPPRPIIPTLRVNLDVSKTLDLAFIGRNILSGLFRR